MTDERTPPHNPEAELAVIGTSLVYGDRALAHAQSLRSDEFFMPANRDAWEAIRAAEAKRGGLVDIVSVGAAVAELGTGAHFSGGWSQWASVAMQAAHTPDLVEHFVGVVREAAAVRRMIELCTHVASLGQMGKPWAQVIEAARFGVAELETPGGQSSTVHVSEAVREVTEQIEGEQAGNKAPTITTSLATLDDILEELEPGRLIVVAARPGRGKTALACNIAAANAIRGIPCLIFSLEMSRRQLARRLLVWATKVTGGQMRGNVDIETWRKIAEAAGEFERSKLWLNDDATELGEVISEAHRWHARNVRGQKDQRAIVFVDYLQLIEVITAKGTNREQAVAHVSRSMKRLAKKLKVPLVLLAQLSRKSEEREGPPLLSDLRESGAIEQDADIVLFPHRECPAHDMSKRNEAGPAEIVIAKNRDGAIGVAEVEWIPELTTFRVQTNQPEPDGPEPRRHFNDLGDEQ